MYIGGQFTQWGRMAGRFSDFDNSTGVLDNSWPLIAGTDVSAIVPDGSGGYYLGGNFTTVAGIPRAGLAHVTASKTLDLAWNPAPNGSVYTLLVTGGVLYAGGSFSMIGGVSKNGVAAISSAGNVLSWDADVIGSVYTMASLGTTLYIGGTFTSVLGSSRLNAAAVDTSGTLMAWDPTVNGLVSALVVSGSSIYIGGNFTSVGVASRSNLASVDPVTALPSSWSPTANGPIYCMLDDLGAIIVGGNFTSIGLTTRGNLAAIDSTGNATSWDPEPNADVYMLASAPGAVVAGGDFSQIGSASRSGVALIDSTGAATAWDAKMQGTAHAAYTVGSSILIGGTQTMANMVQRSHVVALDSTGAPTAWNPGADGIVFGIQVNGSSVYIGGQFSQLGGQARTDLGAVDATTGLATSWNPGPDDYVESMSMVGSTIYIGGVFANVGGQPRSCIAAIDTSGTLLPWAPDADAKVKIIVPGPSGTMYLGGLFQNVGGQPRGCIAQIDASGLATSWDPEASNPSDPHGGYVDGLCPTASGVWASGYFTTIGGAARDHLAVLDGNGNATAFDPGSIGADSVQTIAEGNGVIIALGGFSQMCGVPRDGGVALDEVTGAVQTWDPGHGGYTGAIASDGTVYLGGLGPDFLDIYRPVGSQLQLISHFDPIAVQTYGNPAISLAAVTGGGSSQPVLFSSSNPGVASMSATQLTILGAGTAIITATQAGDSVYAAAPPQMQTLTVNPAVLTVTAQPQSMSYGAALPAFTDSITGFQNGDTSIVIGGAATNTTTATGSSAVNTYAIVPALGSLIAANYTFTFVSGTLSVTKAALTVAGSNDAMVAGETVPTPTFTITGFLNGDTASVVTGSPVLTPTATSGSPIGNYPTTMTIGTLSAANYTFTLVPGSVQVAAHLLTVTANTQSKIYGAALPALTFTITGFVNGDSQLTATTGAPVLTPSATAASAVGSYPTTITIGTLAVNNPATYAVHLVNSSMSVTPAPLTVTANALSMTQGAAVPTLTFTITGFVNGDTAANLTTPVQISTIATASSVPGSYPITVAGATDPNYTIIGVNGTLTITVMTAGTTGTSTTAGTTTGASSGSGGGGCGLGGGATLAFLLGIGLRRRNRTSCCS